MELFRQASNAEQNGLSPEDLQQFLAPQGETASLSGITAITATLSSSKHVESEMGRFAVAAYDLQTAEAKVGDVIILARFPGSRSTSRTYSWDTLGSQEQVAYTVVDTQDSFLSVELLCKISSGDMRHSNFQVDFPVSGTVDKARRYVIPKARCWTPR
jgi:hypothetical protein